MSVMNRSQEYDPQITQISFGLWEVRLSTEELESAKSADDC